MSIRSKLGLFDLTMIIISMVIGVGIFKTPGLVAQKAGSPFVFYLAWVVAGLVSICGALVFAEVGSRLPTAGGFYKIFSHCYNPAFAFMINWSLLIALAGSAAAIASVGAEYIKPVLLPADMQSPMASRLLALAIIIILFVLNYLGIKISARVQNVLSMLKIIMILLFCMAIFGFKNAAPAIPAFVPAGAGILRPLGLALVPVFFTWMGYQYTINFGADIKDPQRNIPRAVFMGISIILLLYITINIAFCQVLGFENLAGNKLIAAELANKFFGTAGSKIVSVMIFISVIGFLNVSLMANPRVYYAMAEDKVLPPIFKQVNEKTQTQEFALSFFFALVLLALLFLGTFEKILNYIMFIDCLSMVFGAATIFILRKRMAGTSYTGFKIRLYPFIPIFFILVLVFVGYNVSLSDPQAAITGLSLFSLGYPLYRLIRRS